VVTGFRYGARAVASNPLRIPAINNSDFYDHTENAVYFRDSTVRI